MPDLTKIDKNFAVIPVSEQENICYYDVEDAPFRLYGLMRENGIYCRMPKEIAKSVNDGVAYLYYNTSGGRVRFVTDSKQILIKAEMHGIGRSMPHFPLTGSASFDMYIEENGKQQYAYTFVPPYDMVEGYEGKNEFETVKNRLITINFPTYSGVKKLYIGLEKGCSLSTAPDYKTEQPVVYYGSSITQGGCCSRPGNTYQAILSRMLDCNFVNLGFSGSAKGEQVMANYIASLDMRAFVYDYDHNAPAAEDLRRTHYPMFETIRKANPDLPILMLSRPVPRFIRDEKERNQIIRESYRKALENGDRNVYFIDGRDLLCKEVMETALVDGIHPNDSGFVSIANAIAAVLKQIGL